MTADAFEERSAIVEFEAGIPRRWAEAFARLLASKPVDVEPERWAGFVDAVGHSLDTGFAAAAEAAGETPEDAFGFLWRDSR